MFFIYFIKNTVVDSIILFFIINSLVTITILWLISTISVFFFKNFNNYDKKQFYECGFKSFSTLDFKLNIGAYPIVLCVLLYEFELLFLLPSLFDYGYYINSTVFFITLVFIISVFITFIIDIKEGLLR